MLVNLALAEYKRITLRSIPIHPSRRRCLLIIVVDPSLFLVQDFCPRSVRRPTRKRFRPDPLWSFRSYTFLVVHRHRRVRIGSGRESRGGGGIDSRRMTSAALLLSSPIHPYAQRTSLSPLSLRYTCYGSRTSFPSPTPVRQPLGHLQEPPGEEPTPPPPLFPYLLPSSPLERRSVSFVTLFKVGWDAGGEDEFASRVGRWRDGWDDRAG